MEKRLVNETEAADWQVGKPEIPRILEFFIHDLVFFERRRFL